MYACMLNGPFGGQNFTIAEDEPPPILMMPVLVTGTTRTLHAVYERDHKCGETGMFYYYDHMVVYEDKVWKEVEVAQYKSPVRICMKCGHSTVTHKIRRCEKCHTQSCPECDARDDSGICARCRMSY